MRRLPSPAAFRRSAIDALPARARRRVGPLLGEPGPRRIPVELLDEELARAAALFTTSEDDARTFLAGLELAVPADRPADPFSEEYRDWTWALYEKIARRGDYRVANETSPIDVARATTRPYPYQTGSARVVGDDLIARGYLLRCVGEAVSAPPARVVEFGPGWGNLTMDLVATGFDVTAVDVSEEFCALLQARCAFPERLHVVRSDMLAFEPPEPFDAAIFFESFHHCADHLAMLRRLHDVVTHDAVVLFAGEPIGHHAYPWGPRLDGISLWSTRTYGWLELGFDRRYFADALARTGWTGRRRAIRRIGPGSADVIVARAT